MQQHNLELIDHAENSVTFNEQTRRVPLLVELAGTPGVPDIISNDVLLMMELCAMVGVQLIDNKSSVAFLMKSNHVEMELPYNVMTLSLESHHVELEPPISLREWRHKIASHLLENAEVDCLTDDKVGGFEELLHTGKYKTFKKLGEAYYLSLRFNLQRKMSAIALATRRGQGNTLIGSRNAIEWLLQHIPDYQKCRLKVIIFEEGEIQEKPWLLLGYNGHNKYDTGLAFLYQGNAQGGRGALVDNNVKRYWRRLI